MSQTPGPTTRSRSRQNTPAPARPLGRSSAVPTLAVGQNFAYGASGKAVLRGQVATEKTSLASALQGRVKTPSRAQSAAIEEEPEDEEEDEPEAERDPSPIQPTATRQATWRQQQRHAHAENDDMPPPRQVRAPLPRRSGGLGQSTASAVDDDAMDVDRNGTYIQPAAHYVKKQQQQRQRNAPIPGVEPADWQVTAHTVPRFMLAINEAFTMDRHFSAKNVILTILAAIFAVLLAIYIILTFLFGFTLTAKVPGFMVPWQNDIAAALQYYGGVSPYDLPPDELARLWTTFRYQHEMLEDYPDSNLTQFGINIAHKMKLDRHERRLKALEERLGLHNETLKLLHDMIPPAVVVQRKDDEWEIPELFWRALHSRMSGDDELWQTYLKKNEAQVEALFTQVADNTLNRALENGYVISRQTFEDRLDASQRKMQSDYSQELRNAERIVLDKVRETAAATASNIIHNSPKLQMSEAEANALAYANIIVNQQKVLQQVNFFAPGLGARVNPHETSPTFRKTKKGWFYQLAEPHPPIAALQHWNEATECWCAAPSTEMGKAQLTVQMAHHIYPKTLVVEHVPAKGTIDIRSAPRAFAVWVEVESPVRAKQLAEYAAPYLEGLLHAPACGAAPSEKHVCIGTGMYDIHAANWVQAFSLSVPTEEMGIAVNKLIVRVQNNWGAAHTCLYRLRLTGTEVVPQSAPQ